MKKAYTIITAVFLMVTLLFSGCSQGSINANINQKSEDYIVNEDFQYYFESRSPFVKTDNGYCFIYNSRLYFYDTETNQAYPVCDKASCEHNNSNCTAYLSPLNFTPGLAIKYYDHCIYVFGYEKDGTIQHNYMYQISLDNFKRKKAAFLYDSGAGISVLYLIHRGYVYFTYDGGVMKDTTATLYRTKIGDTSNDAPEKVYEFNGIGALIYSFSAYGNNLYFETSSYEDEDGNGYKSVLNCMDIHTLESKEISNAKYSYLAYNGKIYYEPNTEEVICLDLKTGKEDFFCNINGPAYISADSNYIYFDNRQKMYIDESFNDRKILVYDKSGKYITEIVPKNPKDNCYFGGDDVMLFEEVISGETETASGAENAVKGYYVLDKSQLTSPDKQFINME